ncbi:MAG: aminodeoxychorismate/anthranilate synthase component II [Pirellulaceae bacterium]|nr:aminodeoxychorismate/anthranilate synthase component II [Pirellulaceae bacterium]
MILLIDNYDSFAHNLARYLQQLGQQVKVVRNDQITTAEIASLAPQAIVISPGPCTPDDSGICLALVEHFAVSIPILGVCLGHQTICQALGGRIVRAEPRHGRSSSVVHFGHPLFDKIASPFVAGRYHSLVLEAESLPESLQVIAQSADGTVMGVGHREYPVIGVQFHPESILTLCGYRLLGNFIRLAGMKCDESRLEQLSTELASQAEDPPVFEADTSDPKWHPYAGIKFPS